MTESDKHRRDDAPQRGVLRREAIRILEQPALVECSRDPATSDRAISVVPLLDDDRVAGFEVRCGCGSSAIVECVYTTEASHEQAS